MSKLFVSTFVILACIFVSANAGKRGGLGESKSADDNVSQLVDRLKTDIVKKICDEGNGTCPTSDAKINVNNYRKQTVSGTNYFISATIGEETYHVKIYSQPWTNTEELTSVQGPKQQSDEITFF